MKKNKRKQQKNMGNCKKLNFFTFYRNHRQTSVFVDSFKNHHVYFINFFLIACLSNK